MRKLLFGLLGIFGLFIIPAHAALPAGYTELEYIRFDGSQYIITNYTMDQTSNPKVELKIKNKQGAAFGAQNDNSRSIVDFSSQLYCGAGANRLNYTLPDDDAVHTLSGEYNTNTTVLSVYIDGVLQNSGEQSGSFSTNKLAFGDINGGNGGTLLSGDVYSFKVYQNNTLVLNLIPAKRNSDNVIGMYDTVNNRFYTNAGSGSFVAGPTACDGERVTYTSATGTVSQNGTPTPTNPVEPVFYTQGDMVLRKVGDYADSYDATTGKITRRITQTIFDGTENWGMIDEGNNLLSFSTNFVQRPLGTTSSGTAVSNYFKYKFANEYGNLYFSQDRYLFVVSNNFISSVEGWKQYLAQQYAAGTPVTVWYPQRTETTEDWAATQCLQRIRVASTKYVETQFGGLSASLAAAVATVNTVVTNTINQAASIATLQSGKQTRPADDTCPAYKQCLLVEDESGKPHWYEITDPFRDFVAPIVANNVNAASDVNTQGYTQLEYIESTGTQYIDTGLTTSAGTTEIKVVTDFTLLGINTDVSSVILYISSPNSGLQAYIYKGGSAIYNQTITAGQVRTDVDYIMETVTTANMRSIQLNGGQVFSQTFDRSITDNSPIYTFGSPDASGTNSCMIAKIRNQKFYRNGTLVRNFVPVLNHASRKFGMYDTVGGRFYGNAATSGDGFTPGPIVANDPNVPTDFWSVTWVANATTGVTAGTVRGTGICNSVAGSGVGAKATNAQMASSDWNVLGKNCWCQITGLDTNSVVTSIDTNPFFQYTEGTNSQCYNNCTYVCKRNLSTNLNDFRSVVFGQF